MTMSDPASLQQYAQNYRRLAQDKASPELQTLLLRMAEVWDALAAHAHRIAAERAAAEEMSDAPRWQDRGELGSPVQSPELSPPIPEAIHQHEHTD
jgi:hypothetical protein